MRIILTCLLLFFCSPLFSQLVAPPVSVEEFVIEESKPGGKLDFDSVLALKSDVFYAYDGVMYNRKHFAILLWGGAVKIAGLMKAKDAIKVWQQIHQRDMTGPEKKALKAGFNADIKSD